MALLVVGCVRSIPDRGLGWSRATTEHIEVEVDAGGEQAARTARDLEELHRALTIAFYRCGSAAQGRIAVTVLSRGDEFDEIVGTDMRGRALRRIDGLVALPRRIVIDRASVDDFTIRRVLAHELTHLLVSVCFASAPPWLHEGLAETFETVYREEDQVIVGAPSMAFTESAYFSRVFDGPTEVRRVPLRYYVPPSTLVPMRSSFYAREGEHGDSIVSGRYASAWALVHMLALGPDATLRARFVSYLDALHRGTDRERTAFDVSFHEVDLDRAVLGYIGDRRHARITRPWSPPSDEVAIAPVPPEDAHVRLAELAWRGGHVELAEAHAALTAADPEASHQTDRLRMQFAPTAMRLVELATSLERTEHEATPSIDALRALVLLRVRAGGDATAIAARLAMHPQRRATDLALVAHVEMAAGALDLALTHAEEARALDPRSVAALRAWGRVTLARGRSDEGREALRTADNLLGHEGEGETTDEWLRRASAAP